ncbi:hypothetical protein D3C87_2013960 [compost metagenome]
MALRSSHAPIALGSDTAGQWPILRWRIFPSTGDLKRYTQVRVVSVAARRSPG